MPDYNILSSRGVWITCPRCGERGALYKRPTDGRFVVVHWPLDRPVDRIHSCRLPGDPRKRPAGGP